ncbi:ArpU family phage packaging/lysis transcriptional regulator [Bacillus wiedmannii]|uniref:ArpU family phage transcriptional regulator n=1 Tax=Bacillus wiedmannii TaxID=1890302 RepID=A0A1C4FHX5_9BACI|nr:ArpU family phage packaging/lysis transcriptional regulator [Bacillus wiedmannii]SCC55530.1 ArpU family phage transcriptional regulator [Bacillus wiedmannii]
MERQLTLSPDIDDKKVQKDVVSVLKEYRALKMRFSNDVEKEGNSLFPELSDSRNMSKWKVQQVEKALNNLLDGDERNIVERKFLTIERVKDSDVYHDLLPKKTYFYEKKQSGVKLIATALRII